MTDIRDINSTDYTATIDGKTVQRIRDSLPADILLSIIISLTIITVATLVKSYVELFTAGMYAQFSVLIVSVFHTIVRRLNIKSKFVVFILHVAVSALFYFVATAVPFLEFGVDTPNRIYLIMILTALTIFSFLHGLKPKFVAADSEFFLFPGLIHVILYLLYALTGQQESARNILIHAIIIAILFVIMRQIAIFDAKYYHSIHKLSKPVALLKRQNRRTIIVIIGIIAIALAVVTIFPYELLSGLIKPVIFLAYLFFSRLGQNSEIIPIEPEEPFIEPEEEVFADMPWLEYLGKALVIAIAVATICLIVYAVRLILSHAQRMVKPEVIKDDNTIDTIEKIEPEKKQQTIVTHDFGTGYERRIRKQFYDKTRHAMKKGLPVSDASTPGEIEKVLMENGDKNISSLKNEYEKVRYGK